MKNISILKLSASALLIVTAILVSINGCAREDSAGAPGSFEFKIAQIVIAEDTRTVTPELIASLSDSEPKVRARAVRAIGRIGDDDIPRDSAVILLWPMLSDTSLHVAEQAAFACGLLGKNDALANKLIEHAFTAPDTVAKAAIIAAGRTGDTASQLGQKLAIILNHKRPGYRSRAALALYLTGNKSMNDVLAQTALSDTSKGVRDTALYSLVRLRDKTARDVYLSYLNDPDPYLQALALRGIAEVGDTTLVGTAVAALESADPNLRSQAISSLAQLQCKESESALAGVIDTEQDERLLAMAIRGLADADSSKYRQLAVNQLSEDNSLGLQLAIVYALTKSLSAKHDPLLDSLLQDGSAEVVAEFFNAIPRTINTRFAQRLIESYYPLAEGPARYAAHQFVTDMKLPMPDWMNFDLLWERITGDVDEVSKGADISFAAERREPWFYDLAQRIARESQSTDNPIPQRERSDIYMSVISGINSRLEDTLRAVNAEQKQALHTALMTFLETEDFVVSREAARSLERFFGENVLSQVHKPQSLYAPVVLAQRLIRVREDSSLAHVQLPSGEIVFELNFDDAPLTALNFIDLVANGVHDSVVFHRVIPNFVAQGGDPRGDGFGGPGYSIRCEYSDAAYMRGTVGMATSGKDTGGSQFFITLSAQPHLNARYTVFAQVVSGIQLADSIRQGDVAERITLSGSDRKSG